MKKAVFYLSLFLIISCEYIDKAEAYILPSVNELKIVSEKDFGFSEIRLYKFSENIIIDSLKNYPKNRLEDHEWKLRKWKQIDQKEINNLTFILNSIIDDQTYEESESDFVKKVIDVLESKEISLSYYYKLYPLADKNVSELDWFIIYILDNNDKKMYTIRNGER